MNRTLFGLLCLLFSVTQTGLHGIATAQAAERVVFDAQIRNNSLAVSPDESMAVVSYSERAELVVYDLKQQKVRAVLNGYATPRNIVFAPDGKVFYLSDSSLGTISKIDSATLKPLATLAAGPGVFGTAISADGLSLYANNQASSTVTRFDTVQGVAKVVMTGFAQPRQGVRLSPDGRKLYVTNFMGDKISVVDVASQKTEAEIGGFHRIRAISVAADGKTLYAANSGADNIAVVDLLQQKIVSTVAVGKDPYGAALSPDGRQIYTGNLADNTVSVIDVASLQVVATISGFRQPRQAIVFTRDGKLAYVLNEDLSLSIVNRQTQQLLTSISAPAATPAP